MTEFLKKIRQNANPCKEMFLPDSDYHKGSPLDEDSSPLLKHIKREKEKAMKHFLTVEPGGYGIRLSDMVHRAKSTAKPSSRYVMMDEVSPEEAMKELARLAEPVPSSSYEKVGLYGWFTESKHDAPNFFGESEAKPKATPKATQTDIPLTQTDMVW